MCIQRIGHDRFVSVTDHHPHVVFDIDSVTENAFVPVIIILDFGIEVEPVVDLPPAARRFFIPERILLRRCVISAAEIKISDSAGFRIFLAVEGESSHGKH